MTKNPGGYYADKHARDRKINPDIVELINKKASGGALPCAAAFQAAKDLDVKPAEVGFTLDNLEIKISKCQLGIFGYGKGKGPLKLMDNVPPSLEDAIHKILTDGKLQCGSAWKEAERLGIARMDIASACDTLGIRISKCQLGAF